MNSTQELRNSQCGHKQSYPTEKEIVRCESVITRLCAECKKPLWWAAMEWRLV
jgi:hypothetical protein